MRDLTFLFGAGASAGAGSILPERPPLGTGLFAELRRLFPRSWGALPHGLQDRLGADFEDGMGAVASTLGMVVPQLMRDMAVYFVQFRPIGRASLYNRLVQDLKERSLIERAIFSTLNYDCLLEFVLAEEELGIDYFAAGAPAQVPVWKLHGSCNMFSEKIKASPGILYGQGVVFEGGVQAWLDRNRVIAHCLGATALAPVMCQYMKGKPTSVSPSLIKELQTRWAESVSSSRAVIVIGVRPNPPDVHIWEPLAKTVATLLFAGDKNVLDWAATYRSGSIVWLGERFNTAYPQLLEALEVM